MSRKGRLGRRPFFVPALTDFSSTPSTQRETGDLKMYPPANHPVPNLTKNNELRMKND